MSYLSDKIEKYLKSEFSSYKYVKEKYILYRKSKLFFDFYLPELGIFIEVQGQQHYEYNKFFHKSKADFQLQLYRDSLKTQWIDEENYTLITFHFKEIEKLTATQFKEKLVKAL